MTDRDFRGYGPNPPDPCWPGRARVAVSFVLNVEEGAELSLADGDERNEGTYEVRDEVVGTRDRCMESHFEYGTRVAYWRIAALFAERGVPCTLNACGRAVARSPWLARDAVARGHEICCHGWRWESQAHMDEATERDRIQRAVEAIREACGVRPVGWHTRSASSPNTRRLLVEDGGFLYDSDDYGDDLPFWTVVAGRPHLVVPYAFDTNDMHFHQGLQRFVTAADFAEYVIDAADWLWREGAHGGRMMSIGLHLRMIGRPGRMRALETILDHFAAKGGFWIARRDLIARHFMAVVPPPERQGG